MEGPWKKKEKSGGKNIRQILVTSFAKGGKKQRINLGPESILGLIFS